MRACACARWNQLDLAIVLLSVMGITLEEIEINAALPINPTIIRIMRVLRIARGTQRKCTQTRAFPLSLHALVSMSIHRLVSQDSVIHPSEPAKKRLCNFSLLCDLCYNNI